MQSDERVWQERALIWMMRLAGLATLAAFPTLLLPNSWMAATHEYLGLGKFPASAIVDYLTRTASALYGFHGALMIVVSTDVRRFRPIITFLAWMYLFLGPIMLAIDLHAGMPWHWTVGEGPPLFVAGLVFSYLKRFVPAREQEMPA